MSGDNVSILLTDDEIVTAALQRGVTWPHPLPTVELDSDAMLNAGARGARSLLVRGLARAQDSSLVLDDTIAAIVDRVTNAADQAIAYVADFATPAALAGSSTYLYLPADADRAAAVDLVSSSGVHDLREVSPAEGTELFLAVVENAFNAGIRSDDPSVDPVLVVSTSLGSSAVIVRKGQILHGELGSADGAGTFEQRDSSEKWDVGLLIEALGLAPASA